MSSVSRGRRRKKLNHGRETASSRPRTERGGGGGSPAGGMALPEASNLFRDVDIDPAAEAFTAWYRATHGTDPDPEAVDAVAAEWVEGALPGTEHAASPHRARYLRTLIDDWIPDHPVTVTAKALLPEWVRWNGEQPGLPEHLIHRAVTAAAGVPAPATDHDHDAE